MTRLYRYCDNYRPITTNVKENLKFLLEKRKFTQIFLTIFYLCNSTFLASEFSIFEFEKNPVRRNFDLYFLYMTLPGNSISAGLTPGKYKNHNNNQLNPCKVVISSYGYFDNG